MECRAISVGPCDELVHAPVAPERAARRDGDLALRAIVAADAKPLLDAALRTRKKWDEAAVAESE